MKRGYDTILLTQEEFDGPHHYMPIKFSKSQTIEDMEKEYHDILVTDRIKNTYTWDYGIDIIRISYHREKDIEEILMYELLNGPLPKDTPWVCWRNENGKRLQGRHIDYSDMR